MAQEKATLARPYANAVFAVARGEGRLDEWSRMLKVLAAAAAAPQVQQMLGSPALGGSEKADRLAAICEGELTERGRQVLDALAHHKRWDLFDEISEQYEALRADAQRALDVDVRSAFELSKSEQDALIASLRRRFDREIRLTTHVEPALLGGVVIRAGDTVIDGSVRGRLAKLSESLQLA
jgi:F-type H+-transporting ATPase subunit delta